ncbi:2170_t:CDS:2 [Paraglomus brasilianum]|uniref:2170_t:CDS:1 n=1 Tax=Paraglomus brasilianum TaxID=144538 RepID=A0A9N8ZKG9_9GLOM|nr:2170_t:CDS:2 [Paraglomus brasilianum]
MKVLTDKEKDEHYRYVLKHGLRGGVIGLAAGMGLSLLGSRFIPSYRNLRLPLKAFLISSVASGTCMVVAEKASLEFDRELYGSPKVLEKVSHESKLENVRGFMIDNKWGVLFGIWALGMAGSMGLIWRNRYVTLSQKLVQARMYAQAITIAAILGSASLSMTESSHKSKFINKSDEWILVTEKESQDN